MEYFFTQKGSKVIITFQLPVEVTKKDLLCSVNNENQLMIAYTCQGSFHTVCEGELFASVKKKTKLKLKNGQATFELEKNNRKKHWSALLEKTGGLGSAISQAQEESEKDQSVIRIKKQKEVEDVLRSWWGGSGDSTPRLDAMQKSESWFSSNASIDTGENLGEVDNSVPMAAADLQEQTTHNSSSQAQVVPPLPPPIVSTIPDIPLPVAPSALKSSTSTSSAVQVPPPISSLPPIKGNVNGRRHSPRRVTLPPPIIKGNNLETAQGQTPSKRGLTFANHGSAPLPTPITTPLNQSNPQKRRSRTPRSGLVKEDRPAMTRVERSDSFLLKRNRRRSTGLFTKDEIEQYEEAQSSPRMRGVSAIPRDGKTEEDLVRLSRVNIDGVLDNLHARFAEKEIYCYIGSVLIAINPYEMLPIYTRSIVNQYSAERIGSLPPHVFAIADNAYSDMISQRKSQSIVISGESGAGKTETTKLILQYLAATANRFTRVQRLLLRSNDLLEALGNACTTRNDNSSRFGKLWQIYFDKNGLIQGGKITQYLLEKSRLYHPNVGERNYHIFYMLIAGAEPALKQRLSLEKAADFYYLRSSQCYQAATWPDANKFVVFDEALRELLSKSEESSSKPMQAPNSATEKQVEDLMASFYSILAGILHLGNITFSSGASLSADGSQIEDKKPLLTASRLLGIAATELEHLLCERINYIREERFVVPQTPEQAKTRRDALASHLYSALFNWLVKRINAEIDPTQSIGYRSEKTQGHATRGGGTATRGNLSPRIAPRAMRSSRFSGDSLPRLRSEMLYIGVLDIFGFENAPVNQFEQFCINYANERLQQFFNTQLFGLQKAQYRREKLDMPEFEFSDNSPLLDLLHKNGGIIGLINDNSRIQQSTDANVVQKMHRTFQSHERFVVPRTNTESQFGLRHFAGEVIYRVENWLEKNRFANPQSVCNLLLNSKVPLVAQLAHHLVQVNGDDTSSLRPKLDASSAQVRNKENSAVARGSRGRGRGRAAARRGGRGGNRNISADRGGASPAPLAGGRAAGNVLDVFQEQLDDLLQVLSAGGCHYIRCIKPNPFKRAANFDRPLVEKQLRCTGIMDTLRIRMLGYPHWIAFKSFVSRYRLLFASANQTLPAQSAMKSASLESVRAACRTLCQHLLESNQFVLGTTSVFLRDASYYQINDLLVAEQHLFVVRIQRWWRTMNLRLRFMNLRRAALCLQFHFRATQEKKKALLQAAAATCIQARWRGYIARKQYVAQHNPKINKERLRSLDILRGRGEPSNEMTALDLPVAIPRPIPPKLSLKSATVYRDIHKLQGGAPVPPLAAAGAVGMSAVDKEDGTKVLPSRRRGKVGGGETAREVTARLLKEKRRQAGEEPFMDANQGEEKGTPSAADLLIMKRQKTLHKLTSVYKFSVASIQSKEKEGQKAETDHTLAEAPIPDADPLIAQRLQKVERIIRDRNKTQMEQLFGSDRQDVEKKSLNSNSGPEKGQGGMGLPPVPVAPLPPPPRRFEHVKISISRDAGFLERAPPIIERRQAAQYGFEDYAREHFRRHTKREQFQDRLMSFKEIISYSSSPLKDTLHIFTEKQRLLSQKLEDADQRRKDGHVGFNLSELVNEYESAGGLANVERATFTSTKEVWKDFRESHKRAGKERKEKAREQREERLHRRDVKREAKKYGESVDEVEKSKRSIKEQQEVELVRNAVDVMATIVSYQHLNMSERSSKSSDMRALYFILAQGIKEPKLRDEIYCTLMKQTHHCHHRGPLERGWQLFAVVCGFFPPSEKLLLYVVNYLHTQCENIDASHPECAQIRTTWALYALQRLRRTVDNGCRTQPASKFEYAAILRREFVSCSFVLMDGTLKSVRLDSSTTCGEVFGYIVKKNNIKDPRGFAIFEQYAELERALQPTDMICDVLSKMERYCIAILRRRGKAARKKKGAGSEANENPAENAKVTEKISNTVDSMLTVAAADEDAMARFLFKKKIFLNPRLLSCDPTENRIIFAQARDEFLSDRMPCSEDEALKLGAILLQAEGDYKEPSAEELAAAREEMQSREVGIYSSELEGAEDFVSLIDVYDYLPRILLEQSELREDEWELLLRKLHKELQGIPCDACPNLFLQQAKKCPLFGNTVYPAVQRSEWDMPANVNVGVSVEGICFVNPVSKQVIIKMPMHSLLHSYHDRHRIIMVFDTGRGSESMVQLDTQLGIQISSLIQDYQQWLQLDSRWARAIADYQVDNPELLTFQKGQLVEILDRAIDPQEGKWWVGRLGDAAASRKTGKFPIDHVEVLMASPQTVATYEKRMQASSFSFTGSAGAAVTGESDALKAAATALAGGMTGDEAEKVVAKAAAAATLSTNRFATQKVKRVDTSKFTMSSFASRKFRTRGTVKSIKRDQVYDMEARLSYSKTPIKDSLTALQSPDANRESVVLFVALMKWMGDFPLSGKDDKNILLQRIIYTGITRRDLRDEILCQIIKQTSENPREESLLAGWNALILACGCFLPTDSFSRYLIAHVQEHLELDEGPLAHLAALAERCRDRIGRTLQRGRRKFPPSVYEIERTLANAQLLCQVHLLDNTVKTTVLDPSATAYEILTEVQRKLSYDGKQMKKEGFSLFHLCPELNIHIPLSDTEYVCDRIAWAEKFEPPKRHRGSVTWKFVYKKRIFNAPSSIIFEELPLVQLHLLYHQAVHDVLSGTFPVAAKEAVMLASLQLQEEFGDTEFELREESIAKYIPENLIKKRPISDWQFAMLAPRAKLHGVEKKFLKIKYLTFCRRWNLYGAMWFNVRRRKKPSNVRLAVHFNGLALVEHEKRKPLATYAYAQILTWSPSDETFTFTTGNMMKPQEHKLYTEYAEDIVSIVQQYVDLHMARIQQEKKQHVLDRVEKMRNARQSNVAQKAVSIPPSIAS